MTISEFFKTNGFSIFVLLVATVALILSIANNYGTGTTRAPTMLGRSDNCKRCETKTVGK